jgi:hypothetical protein
LRFNGWHGVAIAGLCDWYPRLVAYRLAQKRSMTNAVTLLRDFLTLQAGKDGLIAMNTTTPRAPEPDFKGEAFPRPFKKDQLKRRLA